MRFGNSCSWQPASVHHTLAYTEEEDGQSRTKTDKNGQKQKQKQKQKTMNESSQHHLLKNTKTKATKTSSTGRRGVICVATRCYEN